MTKLQVLDVKTSGHGLIFYLDNGQQVGYLEAVDMVYSGLLNADHVNAGNPDKAGRGDQHWIAGTDDLPEPGFPLRNP